MPNFTPCKKGRKERFADDPEKQVPDGLLLSDDASLLNKWLKLFLAETRKQDGSEISTENTVPAAGRLTERHALSKAQLLQLPRF